MPLCRVTRFCGTIVSTGGFGASTLAGTEGEVAADTEGAGGLCATPADATVLLTLPVIGIAFVAQKYLVAGLASGAVKG